MKRSILHRVVTSSKLIFSAARSTRQYVHIEAKIHDLGLEMPDPAVPKGNFQNFTVIGNMVYLSGHLPQPVDGPMLVGKIGQELSVEDGYKAAKLCGLNMCATLKENIGDLDKVKRVVKLLGFVNCVDGFAQQPAVVNGCSDLFVKIFGDKGHHSRSAVGTNSLPVGVPVEIEAIFELESGWDKEVENETDD